METKINNNSIYSSSFENIKKELSKEDVERYCRQIILPEFGHNGQLKLKNSKVLIIGAGGLGSPCLMYLSGSGIGEIGIIDGDQVDVSNLHRQIIHSSNNKGINKAKSAALLIQNFNPLIKLKTYEEHFTNKNALETAENYDLLVDCSDNPATRYLINDICVILQKPLVSGSAVKWEGQLTIYSRDSIEKNNFNKLPCYRCLFPKPSPTSSVCNCADAGVFGPVPGVIGVLQCNEAVKLLLGEKDKILAKKMLIYDALEMSFKVFKLRNHKEECEVCGKNPKITKENIKEFDYNDFVNPVACRIPLRLEIAKENCVLWEDFVKIYDDEKSKIINNQTEKEKQGNKNDIENLLLLDVRPEDQFELVNLCQQFQFHNCPLKEIKTNFENIEKDILKGCKDKRIYVMCKAGNASTHATKILLEKGYKNVFNINNGLAGYRKDIDNNIPIY